MRFATTTTAVVISLAATVAASSPPQEPSTTRPCASAVSSFKAATPSPKPQIAFEEYMRDNDPFAHMCKAANVPGISLLERNRFYEDYVEQARWYNALHDTIKSLSTECRALADQDFEKQNAGEEWRLVGIKTGLPRTWDSVEELPKCEDVVREDKGEKKGVVESGAGKIGGAGFTGVLVVAVMGLGLVF